jgi:hypothetical protein
MNIEEEDSPYTWDLRDAFEDFDEKQVRNVR